MDQVVDLALLLPPLLLERQDILLVTHWGTFRLPSSWVLTTGWPLPKLLYSMELPSGQ
jgi:hypothetical protein